MNWPEHLRVLYRLTGRTTFKFNHVEITLNEVTNEWQIRWPLTRNKWPITWCDDVGLEDILHPQMNLVLLR